MADLFISYAQEDEVRIRPLADALEREGWSVFWDQLTPAGQTWRDYIHQHLIEARCMIVAWSTNSIASKWVIEEADEGLKRGILVPVLLDSIEPPFGFRGIQAANLTDWQPDRPSPRFAQLILAVKATLSRTSAPSATGQAAPEEAQTSTDTSESQQREQKEQRDEQKGPWRRLRYVLVAAIVVLIAASYWAYQMWPPNHDPGPIADPAKSPSVSEPGTGSPEPPVGTQTTPVTVNDALRFRIVLSEDVATNGRKGQVLRFTVVDGLKVGDTVVIPPGAPVTGSITSEAGRRFLRIGNKMTFRLDQADAVDGKKINVRCKRGKQSDGRPTRHFDTEKDSKTKGKGLVASQGTEYIAYIDGDQTVTVRK